jgi:23S rRNA (uracil1939-C5)-methyltransferase
MPAEAVQCINRLAPPRVHYVSCDPATLARDLHAFLAGGFHIEEIQLFDMFPQTFHIETFVKLVRSA